MARTGRPASTDLAPNALADYMRAYRAYRAGRGVKPAGRAAFVAEWSIQRDELEGEAYGSYRLEDAGREWAELRDAVLAVGGVSPNADYSLDSMPRPVYRLAGRPADEMPLRLECAGFNFGRADEMLDELNRRFENYRAATLAA